MVASFVSRANSGYTNRSDDRKSMASLASMMSGRVRLPGSAVVWAAWTACKQAPTGQPRVGVQGLVCKGWCARVLEVGQERHVWMPGAVLLCIVVCI